MAITVGRRTTTAPPSDETAGPASGSRYRRGAAAEEEPPAATSRRSGRRVEPDEAPSTSSRRGGGEDENGSRRTRDEPPPKREARRGWSGSKKVREENSDFGDRFKLPEDDFVLIAFLEDEPFDSAGRHFMRELKGQKAFVCPGKGGPYECPLCVFGDKAMPVSYFNIAVFDEKGVPEVKVWEAGPGYAKEIETEQNSRAVGGHLTSVYFEVKGIKADSGKGATKLKINAIRERDLEAEWNTPPLTDEDFAALEKDMHSDDYVKFSPKRAMDAAVEELGGYGD